LKKNSKNRKTFKTKAYNQVQTDQYTPKIGRNPAFSVGVNTTEKTQNNMLEKGPKRLSEEPVNPFTEFFSDF